MRAASTWTPSCWPRELDWFLAPRYLFSARFENEDVGNNEQGIIKRVVGGFGSDTRSRTPRFGSRAGGSGPRPRRTLRTRPASSRSRSICKSPRTRSQARRGRRRHDAQRSQTGRVRDSRFLAPPGLRRGTTGGDGTSGQDGRVDVYAKSVQPILDARCGGAACHTHGQRGLPAGGSALRQSVPARGRWSRATPRRALCMSRWRRGA